MGGSAETAAAAVTGLLLDEMYPPSLALRLRDAGHDVYAVLDRQVGLTSRPDDEILAWAARNDRCVVTENVRDFVRLHAVGQPHAGIIYVSARRFPRTRTGLVLIGDALEAVLTAKALPPRGDVIWLSAP